MDEKQKTFLAKARSWILKNKLHGPHAFLRFVMLVFVGKLNEITDEFVFKGGNLLWLYIKTPRSTVDIDFVTKSISTHEGVRNKLDAVCQKHDGNIRFSIKTFVPTEQQGMVGAVVTIGYVTTEGQENTFNLDIVYAFPTPTIKIPSPIEHDELITAATIENIVAEKISACQRFKGGNTRLKDFDDLWRISVFSPCPVNWKILRKLLVARKIEPHLNLKWLNPQIKKSWQVHARRGKDLPMDLLIIMKKINAWLKAGLS